MYLEGVNHIINRCLFSIFITTDHHVQTFYLRGEIQKLSKRKIIHFVVVVIDIIGVLLKFFLIKLSLNMLEEENILLFYLS